MAAEPVLLVGEIVDQAGTALGEAQLWAVAHDEGTPPWSGWMRGAGPRAPAPPGTYTLRPAGGEPIPFRVRSAPTTRVLETDLVPVEGVAPLPISSPSIIDPPETPPVETIGTSWQGSQGISLSPKRRQAVWRDYSFGSFD